MEASIVSSRGRSETTLPEDSTLDFPVERTTLFSDAVHCVQENQKENQKQQLCFSKIASILRLLRHQAVHERFCQSSSEKVLLYGAP